jgi:hypothetical protein
VNYQTSIADQQSNINLAVVSVLSIPSFNWYTLPLDATHSRTRHSCNVAGNRQMIIVGGVTANIGNANQKPDPWSQGLGVFDLTDLVWRDSFDPGLSAYQTPNVIKEHISANQYPSTWDSPVVESWFTEKGE